MISEAGIDLEYASFSSRFFAWLVDAFIVRLPCCLSFVAIALTTALTTDQRTVNLISVALALMMFLVPAFYGAIFESSVLQATPGKMLLRIKVTDLKGNRCSFLRALVRNLAFVFSDITCGTGYLMVYWTRKRQCLQDKAADCLVIKGGLGKQTPVSSNKA